MDDPTGRMKAGRLHRVPLSAAAWDVLGAMRTLARDDALIFSGVREGAPLSNMSLTAVLRRMKRRDLTAHGFRSSFRDWAAETGKPPDIAEAALAHTSGDKTVQAYLRGDLFDRRRKLMEQWADYCSRPAPVSADVISLSGLAAIS